MKIHVYLILFSLNVSTNVFSQRNDQSVLSAGGDISTSSSLVLEWTVGETAIETVSSSSSLYTQGFHQPSLDIQKIPSSNSNLVMKNTYQVFPNPTTSILNIRMEKILKEPLLITIVDATGRVLFNNTFPPKSNVIKIDVKRFPHGTYFLRIIDNNGANRGEYKVIKAL